MTNEILPRAFQAHAQEPFRRGDHFATLESFLTDNFHLPAPDSRQAKHFPALPLLMSLLDTAIDRKQPFGERWEFEKLGQVRAALEYAIFALLQRELENIGDGETYYYSLFKKIMEARGTPPKVISLNYDIIAGSELYLLGKESLNTPAFPGLWL